MKITRWKAYSSQSQTWHVSFNWQVTKLLKMVFLFPSAAFSVGFCTLIESIRLVQIFSTWSLVGKWTEGRMNEQGRALISNEGVTKSNNIPGT